MVTTKLNLSMTEPQVRQIYAKQGDTGRVLDITLDQTPEDGTLRILRPDGTEVTSEAVTGGEVSESGETVTFESLTEADVTELTVGIEPVQDLNGYDAPWVGGAGKNKLVLLADSIKSLSSPSTWSGNVCTLSGMTYTLNMGSGDNVTSITINGTTTTYPSFPILISGLVEGQSYTLYRNSFRSRLLKDGAIVNDASGNYTFTAESGEYRLALFTGATTISNVTVQPMVCLSSESSTWQPYSNICPITGHDEVTVTDVGKNRALFANESNQDRASFTYESETANKIVATATTTAKFIGRYEAFLVKGVSYKALYTNKGASVAPYIYRDRLWGSLVRTVFSGEVFTVDTTQTYVIGIYAPSNSTYDIEDFMVIEASETDTSWTPYQSNTYTTSLGQTVYGGTLDLVSGVLTVTHICKTLTTADLNISYVSGASDANSNYYNITNAFSSGETVNDASGRSNLFKWYTNLYSNRSVEGITGQGAYVSVRINSSRVADTSSDALKAYLPTTWQVYAKLATPLTYTLTAQQIKTLVGTNNVWASSGDIVNITFTYGGLLSELPSEATEIVGKCYCDVEQNGVSSMPFTLNVKKNERES